MLRFQRDNSPPEGEPAPVTHGVHVVICHGHQNPIEFGRETSYITTKIDLIVFTKRTSGGRVGQLEVGVDRSNRASQKKSECVEIESHCSCELLVNNVSDFIG